MPRLDDRFYGEDVGYADMAEAPRRERESNAKNIAIAAATTVGVLLLAVVLIRGSLPAMTPEQIVQRDDYEGQQPPRHIFNLYSLKQDKLRRTVESEQPLAENAAEIGEQAVAASAGVSAGVVSVATEEASKATPVVVVSEQLEADKPEAAAPVVVRSYEKSELRRESGLPVVSAVVNKDSQILIEANGNSSRAVTVLPVYTIKGDNTNLRSQPSTEASIVKTLNKGQTVTVFNNGGVWVQVATNDGLGTTGYIHNSLLEIADID